MRFLTAGESHGKALLGILEGVPSGLALSAEDIHRELRRRKLGFGRGHRQKIEDDAVEILSGVRHGQTLGSPVGLVIANRDWRNWESILQPEPFEGEVKRKVEVPRPGHADFVGGVKYRHPDLRNVLERASARETTMRVALGSVARRLLHECGIAIASRVTRLGSVQDQSPVNVPISELNALTDTSPVRCLGDATAMCQAVDAAKAAGETLGGVFEVIASGVPIGLGSYSQWDRRLEAAIGQAFLSLNAIKGVEIGMGFATASVPGSQAHDEFFPGARPGLVTRRTNRSGGIDGGISTAEPIVVRAAMKPLATLMSPLLSVHLSTNEPAKAHIERSDVCAVPAAAVIGESLLALVLAEALLDKFGGDSLTEIQGRVRAWHRDCSSISRHEENH